MKQTILLMCTLLSACAAPAPEVPVQRLIGGDRDAHGCLVAAGYSWSETAGRCVQPWLQPKQPVPAPAKS